jgi:hypothetical protein
VEHAARFTSVELVFSRRLKVGESSTGADAPRGYLARVASGFLFGLGFSIALAGIIILTTTVQERISSHEAGTWHKMFTPEAQLKVESHKPRAAPYNFIVLGTVRNSGKDNWDNVRLEVRLLESNGQVVGICRGYVIGPVRTNQVRYFSVDCEGDQRQPVPEHTGYEIEVVDASYEREDGA